MINIAKLFHLFFISYYYLIAYGFVVFWIVYLVMVILIFHVSRGKDNGQQQRKSHYLPEAHN